MIYNHLSGHNANRQNWERFGSYINALIKGMHRLQKEEEIRGEEFRKEYGIKFCPFHTIKPVFDVKPDAIQFEYEGKEYNFAHTECGLYESCNSAVCFDSELVSKLEKLETLIEVKLPEFNKCITCDSGDGRAFYTGLSLPIGDFEIPGNLYLFQRSCHSYVAANDCIQGFKINKDDFQVL
ncbi:MAG: hypothetical protein U9R34_01145 [Nanoarchaeota archaeon]|nr:hypothetical protein [Nanoarchaeota archaeon]